MCVSVCGCVFVCDRNINNQKKQLKYTTSRTKLVLAKSVMVAFSEFLNPSKRAYPPAFNERLSCHPRDTRIHEAFVTSFGKCARQHK